MPYLVVESLKHGLDVRKSVLTSIPGTMEIAENVHINEGGEAQKRKALVKDATLFANTTFGLQPTDTGLQCYGSAVAPGSLPTGVVYVRLQHPTVLHGGTYNATYHAMTDVLMSDNFNGKAFVVAKFADGRKFLYYDGVLVLDSSNGLVMEGDNNLTALAVNLGINVNAIQDWFATVNKDGTGASQIGNDVVFSPAAVTFTPTPLVASTQGALRTSLYDTGNGGTAKVIAKVFFVLSGSPASGNVVTFAGPSTPTSGDSVVIGNINVSSSITLDHLGDLLAQSINNDLSGLGYSAAYDSSTNNLGITAPASWDGGATDGINIVCTFTGVTVAAGAAFLGPLTLSLSAYNVYVAPNNPSGGPMTVFSQPIQATVSGGTGVGYTYAWAKVSGDDISMTNPTGPTNAFWANLGPGQSKAGVYKCTVDDSGGDGPVINTFTVVLILPGTGAP